MNSLNICALEQEFYCAHRRDPDQEEKNFMFDLQGQDDKDLELLQICDPEFPEDMPDAEKNECEQCSYFFKIKGEK